MTHVVQFVLFGEQNIPSAVQDVELPLVTLWPPNAHVHRTVSPTEMLTVLGLNVSVPPGATVTSTIVLVLDGTPFTTGRPFRSRIWMGAAATCFCSGTLARVSPDSALTKTPVATKRATERINLAVFDMFMLLILFCAPTCPDFLLELRRS